ncbi:hypothetical protein F3157_05420 [Virgibacillus dakarensis]|nr:hypothetical protein [Virgibacillus dakarensis]
MTNAIWIGSNGTTAELTAKEQPKWIAHSEDSIEVRTGTYGYYEGNFGTKNVGNLELIGWYDRLRVDPRRHAYGISENQWLYEFAEVQDELIRRYFILHSIPENIVDKCTDAVELSDEEIRTMVNEVRRFI